MMRLILISCIVGLVMVTTNSSADKPIRFKAQLQGFDANGDPVNTAANGQGRLEVIDGGSALAFRFTAGQLNSTSITTVEALIEAIAEGRASVVIHTSDFPPGEPRGTLEMK